MGFGAFGCVFYLLVHEEGKLKGELSPTTVPESCPETLTTQVQPSNFWIGGTLPRVSRTFENAAVEKNGISMGSNDISFFIKLNLQIA